METCDSLMASLWLMSRVLQAEIDGRYHHYLALHDHGDRLLQQKHFASGDIRGMMGELERDWNVLNETWEDRKQMLTQCYDLQVRSDTSGYCTWSYITMGKGWRQCWL